MVPLSHFLTVSIGLFAIGLFGALSRRNAIGILMAIELILNAAALAFVAFNARLGVGALGQTAALFIIGIAAAGAIVGLALVLAVYRHQRTIFADDIHLLKG